MNRKGGGIGFVILVIALAIVLFLASRAWLAMIPAAAEALLPETSAPVQDHGQSSAGEALRSGTLPNLKQMGQSTNRHIEQLEEAVREQD